VAATTRVTLSASYSGVSKSAALTVTAPRRVSIAPPRSLMAE
jgi:hypothetical protein